MTYVLLSKNGHRARVLAVLFLASLRLLHAEEGQRRALIIGNDRYSTLAPLDGAPINDASEMANAVRMVGFEQKNITRLSDLNRVKFRQALIEFKNKLEPDDSALIYYSGHGFSIDGRDYLAPIDFKVKGSRQAVQSASIALSEIIADSHKAKRTVIILDACRTDAPKLKQLFNRSSGIGIDELVPEQGTGSLIAYSSSEGQASNGRSANGLSLYTHYLVEGLNTQPTDIGVALDYAKDKTSSASNDRQVPAIYDEMHGKFLLGQPSQILSEQRQSLETSVPSQSSTIFQAPFGNLPERADKLADEMQEYLAHHGWDNLSHRSNIPADVEIYPHTDPEAARAWEIARSGFFFARFWDRVLECQADFARMNVKSFQLDETVRRIKREKDLMKDEPVGSAFEYDQIEDELRSLAKSARDLEPHSATRNAN